MDRKLSTDSVTIMETGQDTKTYLRLSNCWASRWEVTRYYSDGRRHFSVGSVEMNESLLVHAIHPPFLQSV